MALEEERPISMVTVLDADVPGVEQGNRLLVKPDGVVERSLGDETLDRVAREAALELLQAERSEVRTLAGPTARRGRSWRCSSRRSGC